MGFSGSRVWLQPLNAPITHTCSASGAQTNADSIAASYGDDKLNNGVYGVGVPDVDDATRPWIAFDADENLLVVDARNHRVQRFTKGGTFLGKFGEYGSGPGQFNMPWGVALNTAGEIYISDWRNDRVQKFSPSGEFILEWGSSGSGPAQFNRPAGIAVDNDGDVYVVDWHNDRVQVFDSQGNFLDQLIGDATLSVWASQLMAANPVMEAQRQSAKYPEREGRLFRPRSVKVDDQNRIFIVDSNKGRLQIYRKTAA